MLPMPAKHVCGHGTMKCTFRVEPMPVQVDCWLRLMLPFVMMARLLFRLIETLLLGLYGHVERILTNTPVVPAGSPSPPLNVPARVVWVEAMAAVPAGETKPVNGT